MSSSYVVTAAIDAPGTPGGILNTEPYRGPSESIARFTAATWAAWYTWTAGKRWWTVSVLSAGGVLFRRDSGVA